jgi:hypothetical protein
MLFGLVLTLAICGCRDFEAPTYQTDMILSKRTSPTILEQAKIAVPEFENHIDKLYQLNINPKAFGWCRQKNNRQFFPCVANCFITF